MIWMVKYSTADNTRVRVFGRLTRRTECFNRILITFYEIAFRPTSSIILLSSLLSPLIITTETQNDHIKYQFKKMKQFLDIKTNLKQSLQHEHKDDISNHLNQIPPKNHLSWSCTFSREKSELEIWCKKFVNVDSTAFLLFSVFMFPSREALFCLKSINIRS